VITTTETAAAEREQLVVIAVQPQAVLEALVLTGNRWVLIMLGAVAAGV